VKEVTPEHLLLEYYSPGDTEGRLSLEGEVGNLSIPE